jgi:glycosyltransferase involved in cell wall biosynthesis
MVSVIITSFNYDRYIERAIRSCLNQSLARSEYEIIVVDDASTDNTGSVLMNYADEVRVITMKKNAGLSAARNAGIKAAKGQFIVFLDADDYVQQDILFIQKTFLIENNNLDAVSVDYYLVDERGSHIEHINATDKPIACGIMFRKDLLFDIGLYDESFRAREEEDLRIRFLSKHSIYNIILPLYRYRMHERNLTKNKKEMDKFRKKLTRKHPGSSSVHSSKERKRKRH